MGAPSWNQFCRHEDRQDQISSHFHPRWGAVVDIDENLWTESSGPLYFAGRRTFFVVNLESTKFRASH
jgi:hypothetical protein